jgi:hypothetical protein
MKQAADADQEPDFYKIADEHPVPEKTEDTSILLQCTLQGGPKARMPIFFGTLNSTISSSVVGGPSMPGSMPATVAASQTIHIGGNSTYMRQQQFGANPTHLYHQSQPNQNQMISQPNEVQNNEFPSMDIKLPAQTNAISGSTHQISRGGGQQPFPSMPVPTPIVQNPITLPMPSDFSNTQQSQHFDAASSLNTPSFGSPTGSTSPRIDPSDPASQFAAGFAAATALSQQQLRAFLGQALASVQNSNASLNSFGVVAAPVPVAHCQAPQQQQQQGYQQHHLQGHPTHQQQQQQRLQPLPPPPRHPLQQQQQQPHSSTHHTDPPIHHHYHDSHNNHQHPMQQPVSAFTSTHQSSNNGDEYLATVDVWTPC